MWHLSLNEALTWLCFTTDFCLLSPSRALLFLLPFHPPSWNLVAIPGTKTCKWGVLLNWYCQMWCEQMSCAPLISYTDDYAGAVPKARKGQALLPVDLHVFFPARQDCKLNFWDQGKSIFILFQLFQISYLRTVLHVRILVPVYCVLCLWETHRNAIFSLLYFCTLYAQPSVLKAVSCQDCRNCQKAPFFLSVERRLFVESKWNHSTS